jgi:two-component system NarL family sensor kinase
MRIATHCVRLPSLFVFLVLNIFYANAADNDQRSELDSVYQEWQNKSNSDSVRFASYRDYIYIKMRTTHTDSAVLLARDLRHKARILNYRIGDAYYYDLMGTIALRSGNVDSSYYFLKKGLEVLKEQDNLYITSRIHFELANIYQIKDQRNLSLKHYQLSMEFAQKNQNFKQLARAYKGIGELYGKNRELDSAYKYLFKSKNFYEKIDNPLGLANVLTSIGTYKQKEYLFIEALEIYNKCLVIFEAHDHLEGIAVISNNIANTYMQIKMDEKAIPYLKKAVNSFEEIGREDGVAVSYSNIAGAYQNLGKNEESIRYSKIAIEHFQLVGTNYQIARAYNILGVSYYRLGNNEQAFESYQKALKHINGTIHEDLKKRIQLNLGWIHLDKGETIKAIKLCKDGYITSNKQGKLKTKRSACECLYKAYKTIGYVDSALAYHELMTSTDEELDIANNKAMVSKMEHRQMTIRDSMNLEAASLKAEIIFNAEVKKKNFNRNIALLSTTILLMLSLSYISYRKQIKTQKILAEEKIDRLLQYEQLKKVDAMLEGQYQERQRISEDLHDKLGGRFSALQFAWSAFLSKAAIVDKDDKQRLEVLDQLINTMSSEVKDIIQNTARLSNSEFGLEASLDELKYLTESSQNIEVNIIYNSSGIPRKTEHEVYKIVLELLSNTLKYAKASIINIQLNETQGHVILMVEDNGKGFNVEKDNTGMGIKIIKARAERLGAIVHIDSKLNNGTSAVLEFDV